jgi:pimeloyl-ACP methyl ester carboxylesterase
MRERHLIGETVQAKKPRRAETATDLLALVQTVTRNVCGLLEPPQPDVIFQSQGVTSMLAVEMSDDLSRVLDRRLPATVALDHNTPRALADYLALESTTEIPDSFEQIYRKLSAAGAAETATNMLLEVSRLRPTVARLEIPHAVPLTDDAGDTPVLVCFPSVLPLSSPEEYAKFACAFDGDCAVYALPQPGFVAGQAIPASRRTLVTAHAAAVREVVGQRPFVLCGHSSGGWIAYAVAQELKSKPPSGIVLLDSHWPHHMSSHANFPALLQTIIAREQALGIDEVGMTRLTATGNYLRLFDDWIPPRTEVSVLHVAAEENGAQWELPCVSAHAPGDHFSMIDGATHAVHTWLSKIGLLT